jgi:hypothetical protein
MTILPQITFADSVLHDTDAQEGLHFIGQLFEQEATSVGCLSLPHKKMSVTTAGRYIFIL